MPETPELKRPCADCPFRRCYRAEPRRVDPAALIGQAVGPFLLPCHSDATYGGPGSDAVRTGTAQCAGAAVFRANLGIAGTLPPTLRRLEADRAEVFADEAELLAHHTGRSLEEARRALDRVPPVRLMVEEMRKVAAGEGHLYTRAG